MHLRAFGYDTEGYAKTGSIEYLHQWTKTRNTSRGKDDEPSRALGNNEVHAKG